MKHCTWVPMTDRPMTTNNLKLRMSANTFRFKLDDLYKRKYYVTDVCYGSVQTNATENIHTTSNRFSLDNFMMDN